MRPAEIAARAAVIRLDRPDLAQMAGISNRSTRLIFSGQRPGARISTIEALENALVAEERRLLRHLLDVHGVPADWHGLAQQRIGSESEPIPAAAGEAVS